MSKTFLTLIVLLFTSSMLFAQDDVNPKNKTNPSKVEIPNDSVYYTCPIHPDVRMNRGGVCPKCKIGLEKKTEKITQSKTEKQTTVKAYTCSMHPEVITDKPGKCTKCGMDLIEKK